MTAELSLKKNVVPVTAVKKELIIKLQEDSLNFDVTIAGFFKRAKSPRRDLQNLNLESGSDDLTQIPVINVHSG